jgi:hypothetical protein
MTSPSLRYDVPHPQAELRRIHLPHTWLNGPLSRAQRGEALSRESSILYLQMEPLFAPVSLWGPPSRGDFSPSGGILVRLVVHITRGISQECQLALRWAQRLPCG